MWKSIENCILISENKIQNWKYKIQNTKYKIQNNIIKYYFATFTNIIFCKKNQTISKTSYLPS